ncbi:hypothetical protein BDZ91DRAFT_760204 [Kalaharituber pfeilii]|nr:hypothetical protein BDZ91DRAFT_760204 [Kalaharituber pfeilii]
MATNIEVYNARRKQNTIARTQLDRKSSHSSPNATTPKPSVGKHSASTSAKPDLKDQQRMKAVIAKYQQILADEHAYIVIHALRAARYVVNNRYSGSPEAEKRDMPAIDTIPASTAGTVLKEKDLTKGRFTVRNYSKANSSGTEIKLQVKGHVAPSPSAKGIPRLPKYHAYTTLRNNILAEDDEFMRYFPYFGEEIDENDVFDMLNLEEAFVDRTKNAQEENMRAEKGIVFVDYIDRFLKDLDLDMNAITNYLIGDLTHTNWPHSRKKNREKYLPEDFDHTETKVQSAKKKLTPVSMAELERAEILCSVFWDIMDFSLWEVAKRADEGVKESMAPARISGGNQGSASKMPGGKVAAAAIAAMTGGNPQPYSLESYAALNCLYCYMHECPFHVTEKKETFNIACGLTNGLVNTSKDSLFLSSNGNTPLPTTTSGSRKHAFAEGAECSKGCFIKASDEDRAKKTVWTKAQMQLLQASAVVLRENPRASCLMACVINKYCYEVEAELQRQGLLSVPPELPPAVAAIEPPNQKGLKRKRTTKQYEYTDCQRTSHASMHLGMYLCRVRESMHSKYQLPLREMESYNEELAKECCQNVALQRDVPRRTLLGISGVSGLGLFIGESVKKDTFLGEYKGEVITHEEAERRGKLYDKRAQVIDATRAGNKFRFVNHYKKPNCFAKVLFANCIHRIGMFAKRDLVAGEELYFDYG